MIVPFIGPAIGMILPLLIGAFLPLDPTLMVFLAVALLVLQVFVMNVLAPIIMGSSVGLHPLLVLMALLVGIKEAGLVGAIFGIPIVGVLWATTVHLLRRRGVIPWTSLEPQPTRAAPGPLLRLITGLLERLGRRRPATGDGDAIQGTGDRPAG